MEITTTAFVIVILHIFIGFGYVLYKLTKKKKD